MISKQDYAAPIRIAKNGEPSREPSVPTPEIPATHRPSGQPQPGDPSGTPAPLQDPPPSTPKPKSPPPNEPEVAAGASANGNGMKRRSDNGYAEQPLGQDRDLAPFLTCQIRHGSANIYAECLEFMERLVLSEVLRQTNGNQSRAAKMLGITRGSLRHKIRRLGLTIKKTVKCRD